MADEITLKVERAIQAIAEGRIIAVVDDEERENEGDLIMAACKATPEALAFIIRHTCGIVCAPVSLSIAQRLGLKPMVQHNDAPLATAFTVSVDVRKGLTTGISAIERANTLKALSNQSSKMEDFVRPGHIFPLCAREGGVLIRSGHTEAAVDLCALANLPQAGAICELVNDDGTVMKGKQIVDFCEEHNIPLISVADLITYRRRRETLVEAVGERTLMTSIGSARALAFRSKIDGVEHLALIFGNIDDGRPVPTRLHRSSILDDVFGERQALEKGFKAIAERDRGVLVYLREGGVGVAHESILRDSEPSEKPAVPHKDKASGESAPEWHEVGLGAQILRDLSIKSIELLSNRELHYVGLDGFGIDLSKVTPI